MLRGGPCGAGSRGPVERRDPRRPPGQASQRLAGRGRRAGRRHAAKFTEPTIGPGGRAIDLRLLGYDLDRLKAAATELRSWLQGFEGVVDLSDDLRPGKREYRLHLKPSAGVLGLDAKAVSDQVRGAFQGIEVDEFPVGPES